MIGREFCSLISERNLIGCKIYLNLSTNSLNKISTLFQSAVFTSDLLEVTNGYIFIISTIQLEQYKKNKRTLAI